MVKKTVADLSSSILHTHKNGNDQGYAETWKLFITQFVDKGQGTKFAWIPTADMQNKHSFDKVKRRKCKSENCGLLGE